MWWPSICKDSMEIWGMKPIKLGDTMDDAIYYVREKMWKTCNNNKDDINNVGKVLEDNNNIGKWYLTKQLKPKQKINWFFSG